MLANGFNPMLTLQCKFLFWWENISSGVELRTNAPTARGELKAFVLSVVGRQKGLTRRDLPRLRFVLNRKDPCPTGCLRVLLVGNWVCGAKYVHCTGANPTLVQINEVDTQLREVYRQDIFAARRDGRKLEIQTLRI